MKPRRRNARSRAEILNALNANFAVNAPQRVNRILSVKYYVSAARTSFVTNQNHGIGIDVSVNVKTLTTINRTVTSARVDLRHGRSSKRNKLLWGAFCFSSCSNPRQVGARALLPVFIQKKKKRRKNIKLFIPMIPSLDDDYTRTCFTSKAVLPTVKELPVGRIRWSPFHKKSRIQRSPHLENSKSLVMTVYIKKKSVLRLKF